MNYGRFFALDLKSSKVEEGISFFNYIDLVETRASGTNQMSPECPIFVTITPTSVKFILQFCVYETTGEEKYKFSFPDKDTAKIEHIEEVLIELPLKETNGPSLSSVVKHLYSSVFPIRVTATAGYIEELIARRYDLSDKPNETYRILQQRDAQDVSYSSLFIWDMMSNDSNKAHFQLSEDGKYVKVLRKLLLDFFFDLMHSDVFKNSAHYDDVYKALMDDFFCSAVIKKSEFYYQRELINRLSKDPNLLYKSEKTDLPIYKWEPRDSVFIYAGSFDRAEREWLDCILNPQSDKEFEYVASWYSTEAVEDDDEHPYEVLLREIKDESKIKSSSWFVSPEEEHRRVYKCQTYIRTGKQTITKTDYPIACANNLVEIIRAQKSHSDRMAEINNRKQKSSQWLFKRYAFADAFRLSFFRGFNLMLCTALILGISFSRSILVNCTNVIDCLLPLFLLILAGLLISFCSTETSIIAEQKNLTGLTLKKIIKRKQIQRWCNVIGLICIVLLAIEFSSGVWMLATVGIAGLLLMLTLLFSRGFRKFYNPLSRYIHLAFPRLVASITAAWLTIALSEDLFKAFFDAQWSGVMVGILLFIIFVFVMFEVDKAVPKVGAIKKVGRTVEFMLISFVMSLLVGVVVINFTGDKMLERSGFLPEYYRNYVIHDNMYNEHGVIIDDNLVYNESLSKFASSIKLSELDTTRAWHVITYFSSLKHEYEFDEKIRLTEVMLDSLKRVPDSLLTVPIQIKELQKNFILRNENPKFFVNNLENLYFRGSDQSIANIVTIGSTENKFFILYDFLIQFAVVAMFIGIFIQMIFEEKNLTES